MNEYTFEVTQEVIQHATALAWTFNDAKAIVEDNDCEWEEVKVIESSLELVGLVKVVE